MLAPLKHTDHETSISLADFLQDSTVLPAAFHLRMQQLADAARWLGGFFHAAAIVLQLPGGAEFQPIRRPGFDFHPHVWTDDRRRPLGLLAEVLRRLRREKLLAQICDNGATPIAPPRHVRRRLNRLTQSQLVFVAVNCLDRLLVAPHLPVTSRFRAERLPT